eukprot:9070304-Prorocentrum_lima.AAC.1
MTSSLVGSEMCIRDSFSAKPDYQGRLDVENPVGDEPPKERISVQQIDELITEVSGMSFANSEINIPLQ